MARLATGLNEAAGDFSIRAVIITSEGDHFTAGNDIKDFMENPPTNDDSEVAKFLGFILKFSEATSCSSKRKCRWSWNHDAASL